MEKTESFRVNQNLALILAHPLTNSGTMVPISTSLNILSSPQRGNGQPWLQNVGKIKCEHEK
jgi:hypothetical protein